MMHSFRLFFLGLICLTGGLALEANPLEGSQAHGDGWFESPWLGWYKVKENTAWIYHQELGWMYVQGSAANSVWFWSADSGWSWTSNTRFPTIWNAEDGWLYYYEEYKEVPYFYSYRKFRWFEQGEVIDDGSPSFFPISESIQEELKWTYRVNQGQSIYYYSDGVVLYFLFSEMNVVFNRTTGRLTTTMDGTISGSATGNVTSELVIYLSDTADGFYTVKETMDVTMGLYVQGKYVQAKLEGVVDNFSKASPFLLDRNDWDQLAEGSIITGKGDTSAELDILLSATGAVSQTERVEETVDYSQAIKVVAHYEEYQVGNRVYQNVVELEDETYAFDVDGRLDRQTETYFLAEGVGIISATNFGDIFGSSADFKIELISTNF